MENRRKLKFALAVLALPVAVWLAFIGWSRFEANQAAAAGIRLAPGDPVVVGKGKALYHQHCAACHGNNLEGEPNWREPLPNGRMPAPPHDATGHTWHHSDQLLFAITKYGPARVVGGGHQSNMPGYVELLTDDQIIQVLSFIKSTWPDTVKTRHDAINASQPRQK